MRSKEVIAKFEEALQNISDIEIDAEKIKSHFDNPETLNNLLAYGPVVCSIFNHSTFKFEFMSQNVEQMVGISAEQMMGLEYQEFLKKHFHPVDLKIVVEQLFADTVTVITKNADKDALCISIHYNYRMQTAAGNWIKVEQQTTPIKLNEKGNMLLDQSFYSPAGMADYDADPSIQLSIYLRASEDLYKRVFVKTYSQSEAEEKSFTERELEVLKLLARGKTSKEIGRELFISKSTVVTHRKNMLKKFGLSNTGELIAYAFKSGVMQ